MNYLPKELWEIILIYRREIMWKDRKEMIHHLLSKTILPDTKERRRFTFQDYSIVFFRTPHLEITLTRKHNRFYIQQVITYQNGMNTRFIYCPTHRIQ